jgi:hypothetical protein
MTFIFQVINGLLSSLNHPALREKIWCKPKESYLVDLAKKKIKSKEISKHLVPPE